MATCWCLELQIEDSLSRACLPVWEEPLPNFIAHLTTISASEAQAAKPLLLLWFDHTSAGHPGRVQQSLFSVAQYVCVALLLEATISTLNATCFIVRQICRYCLNMEGLLSEDDLHCLMSLSFITRHAQTCCQMVSNAESWGCLTWLTQSFWLMPNNQTRCWGKHRVARAWVKNLPACPWHDAWSQQYEEDTSGIEWQYFLSSCALQTYCQSQYDIRQISELCLIAARHVMGGGGRTHPTLWGGIASSSEPLRAERLGESSLAWPNVSLNRCFVIFKFKHASPWSGVCRASSCAPTFQKSESAVALWVSPASYQDLFGWSLPPRHLATGRTSHSRRYWTSWGARYEWVVVVVRWCGVEEHEPCCSTQARARCLFPHGSCRMGPSTHWTFAVQSFLPCCMRISWYPGPCNDKSGLPQPCKALLFKLIPFPRCKIFLSIPAKEQVSPSATDCVQAEEKGRQDPNRNWKYSSKS